MARGTRDMVLQLSLADLKKFYSYDVHLKAAALFTYSRFWFGLVWFPLVKLRNVNEYHLGQLQPLKMDRAMLLL